MRNNKPCSIVQGQANMVRFINFVKLVKITVNKCYQTATGALIAEWHS